VTGRAGRAKTNQERRLIEMRRALILTLLCALAVLGAPTALAGEGPRDRAPTLRDRVDDLQQEIESLTEDIEDLREPVEEFELFDQCAYTIGVTQYGSWGGDTGFLFGPGGAMRRPALAMDMRGFGTPQYDFLAFPGEEPPSIECNEDAGEEFIDG
jgi:hypothetical protein